MAAGDTNDICVQPTRPIGVQRLDKLCDFFIDIFKQHPTFIVKVPGRVNLIGEHIDYCGYPVLPMAIEQNILIAAAPSTENRLHLVNINPKYKEFECELNSFKIEVPKSGGPEWHNYFLCGLKGILDALPESQQSVGMFVAVSGNIPPASGLSSSSALVSASALTTSYCNKFSLCKQYLSTAAANCERFIGTQGGGMDQAIAFLAEQGCAQYIEWNPLKATPVSLPNDLVFVIANSLAEANKAANSDFNQRVVECRIGCSILAKRKGLAWRDFNRFANLQAALKYTADEMESLTDKILSKKIYSREDVLMELEISDIELEDELLSKNTCHLQEFKLRQRALHVIKETNRVAEFRKVATSNGSFEKLAKLMRQSHESLQFEYECSHERLDELVSISDKFGVGARLTGAGWGGSIVAACNSIEQSQKYIDQLKKDYYHKLPNCANVDLSSVVFATSPQSGAEIYLY